MTESKNAKASTKPLAIIKADDKPKLHYYHEYGTNQAIRMLLSHAKIEYELVKIDDEDLVELIGDGHSEHDLAVWEVNEKEYYKTSAIIRLLGKLHGYYSLHDHLESYNSDWAICTLQDIYKPEYL